MEPSESSTRELTLEEAVSFAILLQQNEQLAEAHEVFRRVLEPHPIIHVRCITPGCSRINKGETAQPSRSSSGASRSCLIKRTGTATSASSSKQTTGWTAP